MAPKRLTPMEEPPSASSSSDEEEETAHSGKDEASSSDGEKDDRAPPNSRKLSSKPSQAPKPPHSNKPESESESESGSESDSESEPELPVKNAPNATVKPIASKPMEGTSPPKTTKPRSKPARAVAGEKRASENDSTPKDSKRAKKKDSEAGGEKSEDVKKQLFQRLWSEDDEIAVLEGIIEFTEKKGVDPAKDMNLFYEFIKNSLHFDVTLTQLKDKVSRLKKKFGNHVVKGKKGEDKTFSKPHDRKAFELWKKIWGSGKTGGGLEPSSAKPNGKPSKSGKSLDEVKAEPGIDSRKEGEGVEKMEVDVRRSCSELRSGKMFDKSVDFGGMADYVVKRGLDLVDGEKKAKMEEKWRKLHVEEVELFLKRIELMREQAKLMLEAYKAGED